MEERKEIGKRIRSIRQAKEMTQREFADSLMIARGHVANLEAGNCGHTSRLLYSICDKHDIALHWLMFGEGAMKRGRQENGSGKAEVGIKLPEAGAANSDSQNPISVADRCLLTLDFTAYPEGLVAIKQIAEEEDRTPELQARHFLRELLKERTVAELECAQGPPR